MRLMTTLGGAADKSLVGLPRTTLVLFAVLAVCHAQTGGLSANPTTVNVTATQDGPLPPVQQLSIVSTTGQSVAFRVIGQGDRPTWLRVDPESPVYTTPLTFRLVFDQTGLKPGQYTFSAVLMDLEGKPLGITLNGSLTVVAPAPPKLEVSPASLRFEARAGAAAPPSQSILLQNTGFGGIPPVGHTVANGSKWITHFLTCQKDCTLAVTVDPKGLAPGTYFDAMKLTTAAGAANVPVSFLVAAGVSGPLESRMAVDPGGAFFEAREDNGSGAVRDISVIQVGDASLNWTADPVGAPDWLVLSTRSGTSTKDKPSGFQISVNAATKAPGEYQALVRIASPAPNSPFLAPVVLRVTPASTPPVPVLNPAGLVLRPAAPNQGFRLFASSRDPIRYSVSVAADGGLNWFSASPTSGTVSTAAPARIDVRTTTTAPGIYFGSVSVSLDIAGSTPRVLAVNVIGIVLKSAPAAAHSEQRTAACVPQRLAAVHTGLPRNFQTTVAWPIAISLRVVNDCGEDVTDGQVTLTFSNGDPPLPLAPRGSGSYTGTWTPRGSASPLSISARIVSGTLSEKLDLSGSVSGNTAPVLSPGGVLNNLNPQLGAPLAPGTIVQIFGSNLATATGQPAFENGKLSTSYQGASVLIGGVEAPLYFVSPGQINAQIPMELAADKPYQVLVSNNGSFTVPESTDVAAVQPGVAQCPAGNAACPEKRIIAQHNDYSLIDAANPARSGEVITIYLVGMGITAPSVRSGESSPASPLAWVESQPEVTVDGKPAEIVFAGLTPGAVGLYQINLRLPSGLTPGDRTLVVTQSGTRSNEAILPVK